MIWWEPRLARTEGIAIVSPPLIPWALRLRRFELLAPRYANEERSQWRQALLELGLQGFRAAIRLWLFAQFRERRYA